MLVSEEARCCPEESSMFTLFADSTLPVAERRNYKGVGDAFVRIVGEDGVGGLFRGAGPTIVRAMSLNMGMFAANEQVRHSPPPHQTCDPHALLPSYALALPPARCRCKYAVLPGGTDVPRNDMT